MSGKKTEVSASTFKFYESAFGKVMRFLGEKADGPFWAISKEDIQRWRDEEADA